MSTLAAPFEIAGEAIAPGQRALIPLPAAQLHSHDAPLVLPVHVVHGRRPGPVLFVSAAIHGDEVNGVEIIRRLLAQRHSRLQGTLLALPVVNGLGYMQRARYLPDGRDLNRSFPGSSRGSVAARLASRFFEEVVVRSDFGIDLHTGSGERENLPQIRANLDDAETRRLALAFGVPVVIHSSVRDGSLREAASERGIPTLLYEAGSALQFSEVAIRLGLRGVLRTMRQIGMLPAQANTTDQRPVFLARSRRWLRSPCAGAAHMRKRIGDSVSEGETLAQIYDPYDLFSGTVETVTAPKDGVIVGINRCPTVYEGDALLHIAEHDEALDIAEEVEAMRRQMLAQPPV
ncbi:MAG: succinylglutamate desuccinylase/aspartoacylase family protein [Pseudomonadota bacterium]